MKTADGNNIYCEEGKVCYTEREAGMLLNYFKRNHVSYKYGKSKNIPKRKYFCKTCGYYHVTHLALYNESQKETYWEKRFFEGTISKGRRSKMKIIFA